ncbi:MAG TPA: magnesium transporter CorA family protein [Candidatus Nanoarchaeia archaeon]|nr:magnesium transporter CorA family protein [Candidatus Nanoarchaeia archaeon]
MYSLIAYKNGIFKKIGDQEFNSLIRFAIIDLLNPSESEIKLVFDKIGFPVPSEIISGSEIPSVIHKEDYLYIVYGTAISKDRRTGTFPLTIVIHKGFLILIHRQEIKSLSNLLKDLQTDQSTVLKLSISSIVYQVMANINDEFISIVDELGDEIENLEEKLVKSAKASDVKRVYNLRKTLLFFKNILRHNGNVVSMVTREESLRQFIRDISNFPTLLSNINQLVSIVDFYREMLTEVMQIYEGALSNRLNEIMKYFGVVASIFLWPTMVANIYGQNFKTIPLASHPYGFYVMLGIMVVGSLLMLFFFKSKKWL